MIDHLSYRVSDLAVAKSFFASALAPLGIDVIVDMSVKEKKSGGAVGMGRDGKAFFWIGESGPATSGIHIAFAAETRADVDAFHAAAMAAGGKDNGSPGLRPHYHENYYGAYVLDTDGNNIEAVCRRPE
jgi:catechol 2,3-dioxygenase-like lactoylglutathione lyase family enzyme